MRYSLAGGAPPDHDDELAGLQARARSTRQALLTAAADRFAAKGYHGTSLSEVLIASDLTKGALYFHFRSKRALADALIAETLAGWGRWLGELHPGAADPLLALLGQTDEVVVRLMYDPVVRATARLLRDDAVASPTTGDYVAAWQDSTRARLAEAAAGGLLCAEVSPGSVARLVVAAVVGHTVIAETVGTREELWPRINSFWSGLLPLIAEESWLAGWRTSGWASRPQPLIEAGTART